MEYLNPENSVCHTNVAVPFVKYEMRMNITLLLGAVVSQRLYSNTVLL
jgi:hypothetical protein